MVEIYWVSGTRSEQDKEHKVEEHTTDTRLRATVIAKLKRPEKRLTYE